MGRNSLRRWCAGLLIGLCASQIQAADLVDFMEGAANLVREIGRSGDRNTAAPAGQQIDTAFSPEAGAERLVLRVIQASRQSVRLAAYSFTSPAVVGALQDAQRRGVDVAVVVDSRNVGEDRIGKARAALNLLKNAGIATRTNARYAIHHDKFIIVDGQHVQTGSFNYSESAAKRNSENVIVLWNDEKVAAAYLKHWQSRFDQGDEYQSSY